MNKITTASLALVVIFIAILLAIFVQSLADEKKEYVTDPIIAHIPIRADIDFSFPDSDEPTSMNIVYTVIPLMDVKTDVSEGIVLPAEIAFVENNLPTGQITLKKGKKYRYNARIQVIKTGFWIIYASPGVYGDVYVLEGRVRSTGTQKVWKAKEPLTRFRLKENITQEHHDILMGVAKNWLIEQGMQLYETEEFNCTILSWHASSIHNINIKCYGCEMLGYSNSKLYDKYYFVIEEDQHTNKTKIRNVYRWAYQTPSGYHRKPVCEEITMKEW